LQDFEVVAICDHIVYSTRFGQYRYKFNSYLGNKYDG
jgi:hypothetical protein